MCVYAYICLCACVRVHAQACSILCKPLDCSPPGSSVHGISQEQYWSGLPFPSPGDLSDPGMKLVSLLSPALATGFFTNFATWEVDAMFMYTFIYFKILHLAYHWLIFPIVS